MQAIGDDINQYSVTWGARCLREAIAEHHCRFLRHRVDPETEVTVCCGSTEAMLSSLLAQVNPDDESSSWSRSMRTMARG